MKTRTITVIPGDGIGPEVTAVTLRLIEASGAKISWEMQAAGASVFKSGIASGVTQETIDSIKKTGVVLKGPLETPIGYGEKSANVTLRKLFETYANVRPARELPGVTTPFSGRGVDLVVVRENIEDLYAGIEHMQSPNVAQCLKLITRRGTEKVVRFAFEYTRADGRKKLHCATKANIMKLTEGMFKSVFEQIAKEYPDVEAQHILIDNLAHQLVRKPEQFDVIVTTNMNGDIISDLTSGLIGGLGFAPSANIGNKVAIFEAVHGSAPDIAGKGIANPTALILSAVMLLRFVGEVEAANKLKNALVVTLEEKKMTTADITSSSAKKVGTEEFTDEIIKNLGRSSSTVRERPENPVTLPDSSYTTSANPKTRMDIGADIFIETNDPPSDLGKTLEEFATKSGLQLKMISSRGAVVYPVQSTEVDMVDVFRCRFVTADAKEVSEQSLLKLLQLIGGRFRWMHIEKLTTFDQIPGFSRAQGES